MLQNRLKSFLINALPKQEIDKMKVIYKQLLFIENYLSSSIIRLIPKRIRLWIKTVDVIKKMDYEKHDIMLCIDSKFEYLVRANSCRKDPFTPEWIHRFIKKDEILFDIGANVGVYSLMAAKFLKGHVKVYAFEPSYINFCQLCKNIHLNKLSETIIPLQIALSKESAIDTFYHNNLTTGGALHALGRPVDQAGDLFSPLYQQPIIAFSIDDFIKKFDLPIPNHIKLDVDGIELDILEGSENVLQHPSVKSIILELNERIGEKIRIQEYLTQFGFEIHSKGESRPLNASTVMYNCIFCRQ